MDNGFLVGTSLEMLEGGEHSHCLTDEMIRCRVILVGREPRIVRCHHDSGNNKAASLLCLQRSKVSNHDGLAK